MARVNVDILGIRELKWTGMGEFNSDDHYIYYCGQESLRRNGVATMVNKRVRNAVLGCNLKSVRMISVCFQGKPFSLSLSLSLYIYIYIPPPPPVLVLCCCMGFSLSCHKWRVFSSGTRTSYCGGFSCGAWALGSVDFSSCGSQALEHRLN